MTFVNDLLAADKKRLEKKKEKKRMVYPGDEPHRFPVMKSACDGNDQNEDKPEIDDFDVRVDASVKHR
jgi:hypothetical protein